VPADDGFQCARELHLKSSRLSKHHKPLSLVESRVVITMIILDGIAEDVAENMRRSLAMKQPSSQFAYHCESLANGSAKGHL